jgi:hypothetical protein
MNNDEKLAAQTILAHIVRGEKIKDNAEAYLALIQAVRERRQLEHNFGV